MIVTRYNNQVQKRILVFVPDAFGGRGGISKFNRDFLNALCSYPSTKEVVALPRKLVDPLEELHNKLTYIIKGANNKIRFGITALQTIQKNPKFDLIICGHINLLPLAYAVHIYTKAPIFLVIHGIDAWEPSPSPLANYLSRYVHGIISVSDFTLKQFVKWAKPNYAQSFVLPNAVQLENYSPGYKPEDLLEKYSLHNKKVLLTLGRLAGEKRYKGFDEVLEAMPSLLSEYPDLVYIIAGEGDDRNRLEAKVNKLNLNDQVIFTGFVSEDRKADYYRLADAFLMPSQGEGFGIVLLEAMACGIPVMASKLDGSYEALMQGKLGIIVDPTDSNSVIQGIKEVLTLPKVVPEELNYFSFENFEQRCHSILYEFSSENL
jgi:phosphatidylinositol alpha-1,6-mannosyltransferase